MKCPHCQIAFHDAEKRHHIGNDVDGAWFTMWMQCSACRRFIIWVERHTHSIRTAQGIQPTGAKVESRMAYPKGFARPPAPLDVPTDVAEEYHQACAVLTDSPMASAALSRRCLQHVLRTAARVKHADLASEIQEVLDSGKLPSGLAESIDAVRNIGNFAAHPIKSRSTGEVVPVEPHEAEWNLEVLESAFDFYYALPATIKRKRAALEAKLASAGKPPLKS